MELPISCDSLVVTVQVIGTSVTNSNFVEMTRPENITMFN